MSEGSSPQTPQDDYYVMFYNVENFFDTFDDPDKDDDEFTPNGARRWTSGRFKNKIVNLSKVVLNISGWNPPAIIALCEAENRYVLEKLLGNSPLKVFNYDIIHKNSPDTRGIDVAFLYDTKIFYPLNYQFIPLIDENDEVINSREILYVSGIFDNLDTIHFYINHWPSRYSGLLESRELRILAAKILKSHIEGIFSKYVNPKVIILGDFNDSPGDESISAYLRAKRATGRFEPESIYNLSAGWIDSDRGTIRYRSQWSVFDQIMVTGNLLDRKAGLYTDEKFALIADLPFLLEADERYGGLRLKRTYHGYSYKGGFSDHLPVLLQLRPCP